MKRPIDGNELKLWCEKIIDQACHPATVQIGEVFLDKVRSMPTIITQGEREYREYSCPHCCHTWLEDRDATDYPEYCPSCGVEIRDGQNKLNEPLKLEQLREMNEEPVWVQNLEEPEKSQWRLLYWDRGKYLVLQGISVRGYLLEEYGESWLAYRRPPEDSE